MVIFIASSIASFLGGIVLFFILYHRVGLKYILHKDWFRAEFIGADGRAFAHTFRTKESDKEFTRKINGKLHAFGKDDACITTVTKYNIPKSYYVIGKYEPINMKTASVNSAVSSQRYAELARNTVVKDLLNAFKPVKLDTVTAFMILGAVVLGGLLILGWYINQRIEELKAIIS